MTRSNASLPGAAGPSLPGTPVGWQADAHEWDPMLDDESSDEDDELPRLDWREASPVPFPSPQPERSERQTLAERLGFTLDGRWPQLTSGNVFWGFGRQRQRRRPRTHGGYGALGGAPQPAFSPSGVRIASDPNAQNTGRLTRMHPVGYRSNVAAHDVDSSEHLALPVPASPSMQPRRILEHAFRPSSAAIDGVLGSWVRRNLVLIWLPVLLVLVWCGVPFPKREAYDTGDETDGTTGDPDEAWVNANFWFFLFWYFGCYVAVALIFITQLFTLYRLNWWPTALGAKTSYAFFWSLSLVCGYLMHLFNPLRIRVPDDGEAQWQLKTEWVFLAFATMAMPACVCFIGLRRKGRQRYRPMLTDVQKPFATSDGWRIPASYRRFCWFMLTMALNLLTLLAGQGYAILYLETLPHTGLDGTLYVAFWMFTVLALSAVTQWIMAEKVRSRALLFVFRYFYFMVYFIFYRNLFARLRSFDQFALIQLLSSAWVCLWYPLTMSPLWLKFLNRFNSRQVPWEEHAEKISLFFYLRNIAQHTTMLAFLGWLSILHFGINQPLYPFFAFDDDDPYNYKLTMLGSLVIWASEFASIWVTTGICWLLYGVNMAQVGLAEMRLYPELVPTCVWTSLHVLMNMLFFLIQLNFS